MVGVRRATEHAHRQAAKALSRLGAHSEHAVKRGNRGGLVAWQPPHMRDEDLVPLTAGGLPRQLVTSHRHSAQTPGPNLTSGHGPAVDGGALDAHADQDTQEFVAVADVAVLVGVAWALKIRDYAEKYVGSWNGTDARNACSSGGTAMPMLSRGRSWLGVSGPGGVRGRPG